MESRDKANEMWQSRWDEGRTGWHKEKANPHLEEFFSRFTGDIHGKRILVPMCGKSVDIKWLHDKGMNIVGVELVELPIKEFFVENKMDYTVEESAILPGCSVYRHGDHLTLYHCDIFKISPDVLGGYCDFLYDRAAIGAIEYEEKIHYTNIIQSVLTSSAQGLTESMLFDRTLHPGPPYSTSKEEMEQFYGGRFSVEVLSERKSSELPDWYRSQSPGLSDASYVFYFMECKLSQEK